MLQASCYKQRRMNSYGCDIIADKLVEIIQDNVESRRQHGATTPTRSSDFDLDKIDAMAADRACKDCDNCILKLIEVEPALRHNLPVPSDTHHVAMVEVRTGKVVVARTSALVELKNYSEARVKEMEETLKRHAKSCNIKEITDRVDKMLRSGVDPERSAEIEGQLTMYDAMPSFAKLERFDEEELREKFMEDF